MMILNAFRRTLPLASPLLLSLLGSICALLCEKSRLILIAITRLIFIQQLRQHVQYAGPLSDIHGWLAAQFVQDMSPIKP